MKKLIFLTLMAVITLGCSQRKESYYKNLEDYKGCIVVDKKTNISDEYILQLKLTNEMQDSLKENYLWIRVVKLDFNNFNIGDTIK